MLRSEAFESRADIGCYRREEQQLLRFRLCDVICFEPFEQRPAKRDWRWVSGGEGGIRTLDTVARIPHFECGAFDHSATSPHQGASQGLLGQVIGSRSR